MRKREKTLHLEDNMYRKPNGQMVIKEFDLPFEGELNADNRWVKLAQLIPWEKIEKKYAELFLSDTGTVAKPLRMALGSLIIKDKCDFTDRETVEHITENPYMQYFIGLKRYQKEPPFDPSLMVHFRKRLDKETMMEINEMICAKEQEPEQEEKPDDPQDPGDPPNMGSAEVEAEQVPEEQAVTQEDSHAESKPEEPINKGKLLLDATCAPADIRYPTDLSLLNEAREKSEGMIDALYHVNLGLNKKPRTYRKKARKAYLSIAKQRKPQTKSIRRAIGKQLGFLGRNLRAIDKLLKLDGHGTLDNRQSRELETIRLLYEQQRSMYTQKTHQVSERIVSISQPHVRPIVRGKANAPTEFGAKLAVSMVDGYMFVDELSWNPFNESNNLKQAVEDYKKRYGCYPEAVLADQIYRNRDNRAYCKQHGIRLSGPALGRPAAQEAKNKKRIEQQDMKERNAIEGGFGVGKRRYGLGRIMARLKETSESEIMLQFIVMNLEHRLRTLFFHFYSLLFVRTWRLSLSQ